MKIIRLILLLLVFQSYQAIALGRLFMTPEQRMQVEKKNNAVKKDEKIETVDKKKAQQSILLNGFIKPKHAASTIWVNGKVRAVKPQQKYHVRHWVSPKNQVSVDLQGKRAELSPGQVLNVENRVVKEVYDANVEKIEQSDDNKSEKLEPLKTENKKKPSVLQQAVELNKLMNNLPK